MDAIAVRECGCEVCRCGTEAMVIVEHRRINVLFSRLDEQQRRWFVAHESQRMGFGGDIRLSQVTGLNVDTIARGRAELVRTAAADRTWNSSSRGGARSSPQSVAMTPVRRRVFGDIPQAAHPSHWRYEPRPPRWVTL